jgi:acyl carrier protein
MEREEVLKILNQVLTSKGREPTTDCDAPLREAGIRSLDFSEVALRVEDKLGQELNFEASEMRRIATVKDVIDFFVTAAVTNVPAS